MAAETLTFVDGFDNAFILRHDLQRMLGRGIPLLMLTDSKAPFDVITGSKYTTEKILIVDLAAIREAYNERTIRISDLFVVSTTRLMGLQRLDRTQLCNSCCKSTNYNIQSSNMS